MPPYKLVIFDCDGVIVDSEPLAAAAACELLNQYGLSLDIDTIMEISNGRKVSEWVSEIERELGRQIADQFIPEFRRKSDEKFHSALSPVTGIRSVLENLSLPYCLASSGPISKIEVTLGITGMHHFFKGKIFSGYELGSWKPDPGLFLHAAAAFNTAPEDCVVVEDSNAGIAAGLAASMTVLHYSVRSKNLKNTNKSVTQFNDMAQLPGLLGD